MSTFTKKGGKSMANYRNLLFSVALGCCLATSVEARTYIDFVETSGSQYLFLDYTPCSNTTIEVKVDNRNIAAQYQAVFCARGGNGDPYYSLFYISGGTGWRFDYNNAKIKSNVTSVAGAPVVLKTAPDGLYVDGVRKVATSGLRNFIAKNPMVLFADHDDSVLTPSSSLGDKAYVRLYYLKAWEDETLKLDLRPFQNETNVFGLYDAVSGREYYPDSPFRGGVAATTLEDDPAVLDGSANMTFIGAVSGTGSNKLLVSGIGVPIFEQGVSGFSSVEIGGGQVWHEMLSGTALWDDDLAITRGRFRYAPPANQNGEVSLANNGTIVYGPTAEIQIERSNGYSACLDLGSLSRGSGGTLLFALLSGSIGSDGLGDSIKFKPSGLADGDVLPPSVAVGRVNSATSGDSRQLRFAKYDAGRGIVPADMVEGIGNSSQISHLTTSTSLVDDTTVGRLVLDGAATQLTIPAGKILTVGTGVGPAGLMIGETSDSSNCEPFVGGGSIDFGGREGVVWLASASGKSAIFRGSKVCLEGAGGVTFAGRSSGFNDRLPSFYFPDDGTFARWTGPTRLCGVDYYMDGFNSIPHDVGSDDLYIEGNQEYGAALHVPNNFSFSNHVHLSGVGTSEKKRAVWSEQKYMFNGPVTMEDDAIVYVQNKYTFLECNRTIDGPGGFGITTAEGGTGYASFAKTNTYAGVTRMFNNAAVRVKSGATLGHGAVVMDYGRLVLDANPGYVVTNEIRGSEQGRLHLNMADIRFTSAIDVKSVEGMDADGNASSGILRFTNSLRLGAAGNNSFVSLVASSPDARLELTGATDYETILDIAVDDGASLSLAKTGLASVTVSAADSCASVEVRAGALVLQNGSGVLEDTASISYWLDASDATTVTYDATTKCVTEWRSKVGEGVFKTTDAAADDVFPHYDSTVNGLNSLRFWRNTADSKRMRLVDFDHNFAHRTTFVVARPTSTYNWMCVMGKCTAEDTDAAPALRFYSDDVIVSSGLAQDAGYLRVDGCQTCASSASFAVGEVHVFTAEMTSNISFTPAIGGYYSNREFNGDICEIIEFNRALSVAERRCVEAYLAKKWGVADVHGDDALLQKSALTVADGATLDLNGHSAVVSSLDGMGSIVNTSATPALLKVKDVGKFKGEVGPNVTIEFKQGLYIIVR